MARAAAATSTTPKLPFALPGRLAFNKRQRGDGLKLLNQLPAACAAAAFFDPQYHGILDKMAYGNVGVGQPRGHARGSLKQMDEATIIKFMAGLEQALCPRGHLFLWVDKFHLCSGIGPWFAAGALQVVDLLTWDKQRMGMGYRTRRCCEYLVVAQKPPKRAKGVWRDHSIRDCVAEQVDRGVTHRKPVGLQASLIAAVTQPGEVIIDPAAGSFSVLEACTQVGERFFLGCDLQLRAVKAPD